MARTHWLCRCGTRNEAAHVNCRGTGCNRSRPPRRVPRHAQTLRDDSYATYCEMAAAIHGVTDESCCVCGKPRSQERRHDRDHGHNKTEASYGRPRGLACVVCNKLMPRDLTLERAQAIVDYLERVESFYLTSRAGP